MSLRDLFRTLLSRETAIEAAEQPDPDAEVVVTRTEPKPRCGLCDQPAATTRVTRVDDVVWQIHLCRLHTREAVELADRCGDQWEDA